MSQVLIESIVYLDILLEQQDTLYALLLHPSPTPSIITLLRPKSHSIHPTDLHLLLSTLAASKGLLREGEEAWIPICLPKYNDRGFLFAWIGMSDSAVTFSEVDSDTWSGSLGIVLIGGDREGFLEMKTWGEKIKVKLKDAKLAERLTQEGKASYGLCEWSTLLLCRTDHATQSSFSLTAFSATDTFHLVRSLLRSRSGYSRTSPLLLQIEAACPGHFSDIRRRVRS